MLRVITGLKDIRKSLNPYNVLEKLGIDERSLLPRSLRCNVITRHLISVYKILRHRLNITDTLLRPMKIISG